MRRGLALAREYSISLSSRESILYSLTIVSRYKWKYCTAVTNFYLASIVQRYNGQVLSMFFFDMPPPRAKKKKN